MKTIAVGEVKKTFAKMLRDAQREDVIVLRHGRPVIRIVGVEGQDIVSLAQGKKTRAA